MNGELEDQQNAQTDNPESPFELEGDAPSSVKAAAETLQKRQEKSGGDSEAVFGLENADEISEAEIPAELTDSGIPEGLPDTDGSGPAGEDESGDVSDAPLILDLEEAKRIIETLLYVAHEPLRPRDISMVFRGVENVDVKVVRKIAAELMEDYADRTIQIVEIAGGYRMCTRLEFSPWVRRLLKHERKWRVSNAGIETLAIIAYKQPITKAEVEEIRRVDCGGVIHTLFERKLVRILGRRDVIGRPIVYGTTPQFLQHFGFKSLTDMPKPEEFDMEMDLGGELPEGDILPFQTEGEEGGGEAPLPTEENAIPVHANGSANGHANRHASLADLEEEPEAAAVDDEEENGHFTPAEGEGGLETVAAALEEDPEDTAEIFGDEKEE
jgi:segregation and condensation protein B